jgi:4-hydroxy-tetrahydrodipicolinate reductase
VSTQTRKSLSVALLGASGRMGREVLALLPGNAGFVLSGAGCSPQGGLLGQPVSLLQKGLPDVHFQSNPSTVLSGAAVAIDFSLPGATAGHLDACREQGIPLLLCATGHDASQIEAIRELSKSVPVLLAANTSLGVTLLNRLVEIAAGTLGEQFDTEISEIHHRNKRDLPSGTALKLGEAVARGRKAALADSRHPAIAKPGKHRLFRGSCRGCSR